MKVKKQTTLQKLDYTVQEGRQTGLGHMLLKQHVPC